ncbi:MAG: Cof-type HAD-IIB family hydrolase [Moraxella sp.]|nr:Cof-type HAD-IIB family hydrolase [Moraxella sp.]
MNLPKIIFFDIDDTLYSKQKNHIPPSTYAALSALKNKGVMIGIATGRSQAIFPPCVNDLVAKVGIDVLVTINGQYNQIQGKTVAHFPLSAAQITQTINYLKSQNLGYALMTADEIVVFNESAAMILALTSLHITYRIADDFEDALVYQVLAFYDDNSTAHLPLDDTLKSIRWHTCGVDILDAHGSKARGIKAALDELGLSMSQAWAFGDGLNDTEMLSMVGFGVAMGNAHTHLKALADFVCPDIDDDGVFRGLTTLGVI